MSTPSIIIRGFVSSSNLCLGLKEPVEEAEVEEVAMVPNIDIPITVNGAEFYVKFQNTVGGQAKGWPNYGIAYGDIMTVQGKTLYNIDLTFYMICIFFLP